MVIYYCKKENNKLQQHHLKFRLKNCDYSTQILTFYFNSLILKEFANILEKRRLIMIKELKKLSNDGFTDKEQHLKVSKVALIMSLVPLLSQFAMVFKSNYVVHHTIGVANIFCILFSFVCSVLCIKNRENRNILNIFSLIISGFFIFVITAIIIISIFYVIGYSITKH